MHFKKTTKLLFWIGLACVVAPALYLVIRPAFPRQAFVSAWMRQAHALDQLGIVLQAYNDEHDGLPPASTNELKKWADGQLEFQEFKKYKFWEFVDPDSGLKGEWIMCPPSYRQIRIHAPRPKFEKDRKENKWLVLTDEYKTKFIPESEFNSNTSKHKRDNP